MKKGLRSVLVLASMIAVAVTAAAATRFVEETAVTWPTLTAAGNAPAKILPLPGGRVLLVGGAELVNGVRVGARYLLDAAGEVLVADFAPDLNHTPLVGLADGSVLLVGPVADSDDKQVEILKVSAAGGRELGYRVVLTDEILASVGSARVIAGGLVQLAGRFSSADDHVTVNLARLSPDGEVDVGYTSEAQFAVLPTIGSDGRVAGLRDEAEGDWELVLIGPDGMPSGVWTWAPQQGIPELAFDSQGRVITLATPWNGLVILTALSDRDAPQPSQMPNLGMLQIQRFTAGEPEGVELAVFAESEDSEGSRSPLGHTLPLFPESGTYKAVTNEIIPPTYRVLVNGDDEVGILRNGRFWAGADDSFPQFGPDGSQLTPRLPDWFQSGMLVNALIPRPDGGWFAMVDDFVGQVTGSIRLLTLDEDFGLEPEFSSDLRKATRAITMRRLPDESTLLRGLFRRPDNQDSQIFVRAEADGSLDFDRVPRLGPESTYVQDRVDSQGRIYVVPSEDFVGSPALEDSGPTLPLIRRFTADGSDDPNYTPPDLAGYTYFDGLIDGQDRVVMLVRAPDEQHASLLRLLPSGEKDPNFNFGSASLSDLRSYRFLPEQPGDGYILRYGDRVVEVMESGTASEALIRPEVIYPGLPIGSSIFHVVGLRDGRTVLDGSFPERKRVMTVSGLTDDNESLPADSAVLEQADGGLLISRTDGQLVRFAREVRTGLAIDADATVRVGDRAILRAQGPSTGTWEWSKDGEVLPGEVGPDLSFTPDARGQRGIYTLKWTGTDETVYASWLLTVQNGFARIINGSVRSWIGTEDATQIHGFVLGDSSGHPILLRGVGPTLAEFGVSQPAGRGDLHFFAGQTEYPIWFTSFVHHGSQSLAETISKVGAFPIPMVPGNMQAQVELASRQIYALHRDALAGGEGVGLAEVYVNQVAASVVDLPNHPRLLNVSCRAMAGTGERVMIMGFVVEGNQAMPVLIQGLGPRLGELGVAGAEPDPSIVVYRGETEIARNDDWGQADNVAAVGAARLRAFATALEPDAKDSAVLLELEPGVYTVHLVPTGGGLGIGLIEVYDVQP